MKRRTDIKHINGIAVSSSWESSITKHGGHWILLDNNELWMTDGTKIAYSTPGKGLCKWTIISDVAGVGGKDLFS